MADNFTFTAGSGSTGAADDIGGVLYPRVKVIVGTDGVNDGDVSSTNRLPIEAGGALMGPSAIVVDSYTNIVINISNGANNQIVSAPGANKQIWVYGIFGTMSAQGTFSLQDEDDTAISGVIPFAQYSGPAMSVTGNFNMPYFKVSTNKALEIDLSGADFDGWLQYGIIDVS